MRFKEVESGVFLGCHQAAERLDLLQRYRIKSILNVCEVCFCQDFPRIKGLHIRFADGSNEWNNDHMLRKAVDFIRKAQRPIFVHCWSGQSRSAAILAWAMSRNVAEFDMKLKTYRAKVRADSTFPPGFTEWVRAWKVRKENQ